MKSGQLMVTAGHLKHEYQEARREPFFQESDVEAIVEHRRKYSELSGSLFVRLKNIIEWKYIPNTVVESDIVMLKLKTPLTLNDYVQKICLPPAEFKADRSVVRSDQTKSPVCLITGWGRTQTTRTAEALQQASIPVKFHPIS